jgi:N-acetylmuramic acid 6-phosphate etherase
LHQRGIEDTERRNLRSKNVDSMSSLEIARFINKEDYRVPRAVSKEVRQIARIVDNVSASLQANGRIIYVGAGTSGRLGILDATEMPPTYGIPSKSFQGIIAGGSKAIRRSIEGAEDDERSAQRELRQIGFCKKDVLIGLSASGKTPFVLAAMRMAKRLGAECFGITCNPNHKMGRLAQETVVLMVGPEVVAGSSRMKCGSAQKMVLNMISTASMIRLGRVCRGLMIGLQPKSEKLRRRAIRIVSELAVVRNDAAKKALVKAGGNISVAILSLRLGVSVEKAEKTLRTSEKTGRMTARKMSLIL